MTKRAVSFDPAVFAFSGRSACVFFFFLVAFIACTNPEDVGERLAKQYCASCHVFPKPELLTKTAWENSVLPQMAFRMGFADVAIQSRLPRPDMNAVLAAIPQYPILSAEEFKLIADYYMAHAPDSLVATAPESEPLKGFRMTEVPALQGEFITSLKYDAGGERLFVGVRTGTLFNLNDELEVVDSAELGSAISDVKVFPTGTLVATMGIMDPSEQARGKIASLDLLMEFNGTIVDSLQRPVFFEKPDLNGDKVEDLVVCNFGNYTGNLLVLEGHNKTYKKHYLKRLPGARKVVIDDFNDDGLNDIMVLMAQGDEQIVIYYNEGAFKFKEQAVLRFPPVYGLSHMEVADFNNDGFLDIIVTNGDNADFSVLHKPYHAVRVFENDTHNAFKEVWSYPMPGASQCKAHDFDNDGDIDIAAISFFPMRGVDGFLFFENLGNYQFSTKSLSHPRPGRWLVMETGDLDHDSDLDIFLGAFNFNGLGGTELKMAHYDAKENLSLLILRNESRSQE